ncbi:MAG: aminotransferase class V-fold PLP-dependent enzyme [Longimicrobiaceae bacterium]
MKSFFAELRQREFGRLDADGHSYLDYTGGGLYPESLARGHADFLCSGVFGNPHSRNPTSLASTRAVEETRARLFNFFDADPAGYEVIFTYNATAALKLVGESYPFQAESRLLLTADNHNSVHGLREYASARGAEVRYLAPDAELRVPDAQVEDGLAGAEGEGNLFVFPAQSNFSGVQHPLKWIGRARERGFDTFLDAAAFVPTNRLSISSCEPDFACVSFYKMFGFPTGVGALLARRETLGKLRRPWFGGGTVRFVSARSRVRVLYPSHRGFEDGTVNYLGIPAVSRGLDFLAGVGVERVHEHVTGLAGLLLRELQALRHGNGAPLASVYGPAGTQKRGATVAFNLLDPDGRVVDFRLVVERAGAANTSLRGGYFCNPGAAEFAFGHAGEEVDRCADPLSAETFTLESFSACMGERPVGAVRASLGIASNETDVRHFIRTVEDFRDQVSVPQGAGVRVAAEGGTA